ncbi:MAG: TolC family protein [Treponema sp.]|nr:TolC family protein [Treponema sp.]
MKSVSSSGLTRKILIRMNLFLICNILSAQPVIETIINIALENNPQILSAKADYEAAVLLSKNGGGAFAPGLSLSGSETTKDNYSASLTYSQPLPGGTVIQFTGSYDYSSVQMQETRIESKTPRLSLSINQSLFPFWMAGKVTDPKIFSYRLQKEYYFNQLQYSKQKVMIDVIQNCIYALIENKKIESLQNSIKLVQLQYEALNELKQSGGANEAQLVELDNSKWSYELELLSAQANYWGYIQKIKSLCYADYNLFAEEQICNLIPKEYTTDDFLCFFKDIAEYDSDPYAAALKLKVMLEENNIINEKQNTAPVLGFSASVPYDTDNKKMEDWTLGLSLDFSPLFSSLTGHNLKRAEIGLESARTVYEAYLEQKQFLKAQYDSIFSDYEKQINKTYALIEKYELQVNDKAQQLEQGIITKLDYESEKIRLDNCRLTYESLILNVWLYEVLREFAL